MANFHWGSQTYGPPIKIDYNPIYPEKKGNCTITRRFIAFQSAESRAVLGLWGSRIHLPYTRVERNNESVLGLRWDVADRLSGLFLCSLFIICPRFLIFYVCLLKQFSHSHWNRQERTRCRKHFDGLKVKYPGGRPAGKFTFSSHWLLCCVHFQGLKNRKLCRKISSLQSAKKFMKNSCTNESN